MLLVNFIESYGNPFMAFSLSKALFLLYEADFYLNAIFFTISYNFSCKYLIVHVAECAVTFL
jgi:hypothetical protein